VTSGSVKNRIIPTLASIWVALSHTSIAFFEELILNPAGRSPAKAKTCMSSLSLSRTRTAHLDIPFGGRGPSQASSMKTVHLPLLLCTLFRMAGKYTEDVEPKNLKAILWRLKKSDSHKGIGLFYLATTYFPRTLRSKYHRP
jgi:hypothetical protein